MKATFEMTRDGKTSHVLPTEDFKSGAQARQIFSSHKDLLAAKRHIPTISGTFPTAKTGM